MEGNGSGTTFLHVGGASCAKIELAKSRLFQAFVSYAEEHPVGPDDVCLCGMPFVLRANKEFQKGELIIAPFSCLKEMTPDEKNGVDIGHKDSASDVVLYMTKTAQPTAELIQNWEKGTHHSTGAS